MHGEERKKNRERAKVCINKGQLRLRTRPRVAHTNCLNQVKINPVDFPGTRGGSGDLSLAVFFLHKSSSYAKIWGKQNFSLGSFPEVGQKQ